MRYIKTIDDITKDGEVDFGAGYELVERAEDAVDAALRADKLSWFACDFATPKTVRMPRTFITTHSGAGTEEAEANCADMAISELKDYLENGNIAHSVNYPTCSMARPGPRAASDAYTQTCPT